ncbi:MAG: hypothetical protein PHN84_03215 [Desulfuromonadaceae bacterium]|nr:hypothetical protein [Desulfuromonadaceae bacterium]
MTPEMVVDISQSPRLSSDAKTIPVTKDEKQLSPSVDAALTSSAEQSGAPVDRVTISSPLKQARADAAKEEKTKTVNESEKSAAGFADVQFVYDQNGELTVRYQDKASNLIYQVPSELMQQMKLAASKAEASVDTKV